MIQDLGHPRALSLSRYLDGDLSSKSRQRIEEHLEQCSTCRDQVNEFRGLGEAVRQQVGAGVPDVADEVIRRRAQGERVVLATPPRRRALGPDVLRAVAAVALLSVGAAALLVLLAPTVSASRSELIFEPDAPPAGASIQVEYSPAYFLKDQDSLRLRVRARKADTPFPRGGVIGELRVATLRRTADGNYSGSIELEPDDVFLAAVVEDFDAQNVDTNFGELWELLVRSEKGTPGTAALESRYRTLEPYNWIMASAWAEEVTERWPENPFGWALLYFHESQTAAEALPDSVVDCHRRKLSALVESSRSGVAEADGLSWLANYARFLGDDSVHAGIISHLAEQDEDHRTVIYQRVLEVLAESRGDPVGGLAKLRSIWDTTDQANEVLARVTLMTAVATGDIHAARYWLAQARMTEGVTVQQALEITRPMLELGPERVAILQAALDSLERAGDEARPLRSTRQQHDERMASSALELRIALSRALVEVGALDDAAVVVRDVWDVVWKPEDLRPVVTSLLATGDTSVALLGIAMLAADPVVGHQALEDYGSLLSSPDVHTEELLRAAEAELQERVWASLVESGHLPDGITVPVLGTDGIQSQDYFVDRPSVLFRWSARLGDATELRNEFEQLSDAPWVVDRIRPVVLTTDSVETRSNWGREGSVPVIRDEGYRLTEALGTFGIPVYVVLDRDRRVLAVVPDAVTAFRIAHHLAAAS